MRIKSIISMIRKKMRGSLRCAIDDGMTVESDVTVMGGANFGSEPYLITLKRGVRISSNVTFITHDGGTWAFRNTWEKYKDVVKYGKIYVGEYSFIGAGAIIMPGVHIGNNCVIAAGSVVTHNVPDGTVWGGVPSRQLCTTLEYADKCLSRMPVDFDSEAYKANKKQYLMLHLRENE